MQRSRIGAVMGGLALCAAAGLAAAAFGFGSASASVVAKKPTTVVVKASEWKFALSKKTVPVGTVVFKVENKGKIGHDFKIDGKKTKVLAPGKSATLKVVFKKKGKFAYLCDVPGHAKLGMKGTLGVGVAAPKTPTTTPATTTTAAPGPGGTVTVDEFEYGFTLTPSTVPSGNVTFVMKNTGTVTHNFDIEGVKAGAFVDPGQTATMTVNLQAGRTYTYVCDVPYHAGEGMEGTFVPQG
ncbi:MAG TPA: cupredoxin domain-containing protein [Gaiellaceae bacterium]|nr:cupredoxin domain-containing protein [Gaiellaceae bacterium]